MRRHILDGVIIGAALGLGASSLYAQGLAGRRVVHPNPAGGVNAGTVHRVAGPNGGAAVGAHGGATDSRGDAAGGSGAAFRGPGGTTGARAGGWTRSADGSAQHQSAAAVSGANGTVSTSGSMTRGADGSASGSRNTAATASSGATYQGQTTYEKGNGLTRTETCTNAAGAIVSCTK